MKKNTFGILLSIILIINFSACDKEKIIKEEPTKTLIVGDFYQGGVIAYIFQVGDSRYIKNEIHGIIADTLDIGTTAFWGCEPKNIGTGRGLGLGSANTDSIVIHCTAPGIAAKICSDYSGQGFSDRFLPSTDELIKLYLIRNVIGNFQSAGYWSSSELSFGNANFIVFSNGYEGNTSKMQDYRVRAVRYF